MEILADFIGKSLDDLDAGEAFFEDHVDAGDFGLYLPSVFPDFLPEVDERVDGHRHDKQAPEGEVRVHVDGGCDQADEGEYLPDEHDGAGQAHPDRHDVGGDPAHEHPDFAFREIEHGQADDLFVEGVADVAQDKYAGGVHDEALRQLERALEQDETREGGDAQSQHGYVPVDQDVVGKIFQKPGKRRRDGCVYQHGGGRKDDPPLVGGEIADASLEQVEIAEFM